MARLFSSLLILAASTGATVAQEYTSRGPIGGGSDALGSILMYPIMLLMVVAFFTNKTFRIIALIYLTMTIGVSITVMGIYVLIIKGPISVFLPVIGETPLVLVTLVTGAAVAWGYTRAAKIR